MSGSGKDTVALWNDFDADWYKRRYGLLFSEEEKAADSGQLVALWQQAGASLGRSPNRYFDEKWYLSVNPAIQHTVRQGGIFTTGFQHYCEVGYRRNNPHWIFSEAVYFQKNPDLDFKRLIQNDFVNGYDHFIREGDRERRTASPFFNHNIFIHHCLAEGISFDFRQGAFSQYLSLEDKAMSHVRTSWYFDPLWYVTQYPDANVQIVEGQYSNALHHYLCNPNPTDYNPNPYFSEEYYLALYPDVKQAVEQGQRRNGYAHFLDSGIQEWRKPHPEQDLEAFLYAVSGQKTSSRSLAEKIVRQLFITYDVPDIFALWIKYQEEKIPLLQEKADAVHYKNLAIKRVETLLPSLFRSPMVFEDSHKIPGRKPSLSVILLSGGDYLSSFASLAALYEQNMDSLEIFFVSSGNKEERRILEEGCKNINFPETAEWQSPDSLLHQSLKQARGDIILFLEAGAQPLYGSCQAILEGMERYPELAGGGGQVIGVDGLVQEAGCTLWRDGTLTSWGKGESVNMPGLSSFRLADAFRRAGFFARRHDMLALWPELISAEAAINLTMLSLALRNKGRELLYNPHLLLRELNDNHDDKNDFGFHGQDEIIKKDLRAAFPYLLSMCPIFLAGGGRNPPDRSDHVPLGQASGQISLMRRRKPLAVFITLILPRREAGGAARRFFSRLEALLDLGWDVSIISLEHGQENRLTVALDYPPTVECLVGWQDIAGFLATQYGKISLLWIVGTETFSRILPLMESNIALLPPQGIILDTVALDGCGLRSMTKHLGRLVGLQDDYPLLLAEAERELSGAWLCQVILATDEEEAALIRRLGYGVVRVFSSSLPKDFVPPIHAPDFSARRGLLFTLPIYQSGDPGHDGFDWFCLRVVPFIRRILSKDIPIWIGNYCDGAVNLGFYDRYVSLEGLEPAVPYETLLKTCRVLVAPARVMNGLPLEIIEAGSQGIPMVLGAVLYDRLKLADGEYVLDGGFNAPERFAEAVARLYTNEDLWQDLSRNTVQAVRKIYNYTDWIHEFREVLSLATGQYEGSLPPMSAKARIPPHFSPAPLNSLSQKWDIEGESVSQQPPPSTQAESAVEKNKNNDHKDENEDQDDEIQDDRMLKPRLGIPLEE